MKNAARLFLALLFLASAFAFFAGAEDPHLDQVLRDPGAGHVWGTDTLGRDLALRILQGNFQSWVIGGFAAVLALAIGAALGACAGWLRGFWDFGLMRAFELIGSVPNLVLVTLFVLLLDPWTGGSSAARFVSLAVGIGLSAWVPFAHVTRALVLQEVQKTYVESAIVLGASTPRILWFHLRPHLWPVLRQTFWVQLPSFLLFESLLSFLGFGLQPPRTSLGILLNEGWKSFSVAPHLLLGPGFVLFLTLLSFQFATGHSDFPGDEET